VTNHRARRGSGIRIGMSKQGDRASRESGPTRTADGTRRRERGGTGRPPRDASGGSWRIESDKGSGISTEARLISPRGADSFRGDAEICRARRDPAPKTVSASERKSRMASGTTVRAGGTSRSRRNAVRRQQDPGDRLLDYLRKYGSASATFPAAHCADRGVRDRAGRRRADDAHARCAACAARPRLQKRGTHGLDEHGSWEWDNAAITTLCSRSQRVREVLSPARKSSARPPDDAGMRARAHLSSTPA